MSGKISLVEAMTKQKKMMRNRCSEKTQQVKIQCYLQLRSSLTTIIGMTHILFHFSCKLQLSKNMQMCATMFGWAMYQMMESNKIQIVRMKEEKFA